MKRLFGYLLVVMLIPAFVLTGCKDSDDPTPVTKGNFTTLADYMIDNNMDLPALLDSWVIDATLIADGGIVDPTDYSIPDWTIFDIRSAASFAEGHIKGAVNVALADVITEAEAINDNQANILVVCYTGQTAGRAVMALRLSGFPNAKVLKFGFSSWSSNSDFDKWSANVSDQADGSSNWVNTTSPDVSTYAFPTWETTATEGAEILAEKVNEMLANSSWSVSSADVLTTPSEYSIYNYWGEEDYLNLGHFAGAFQYNTISLANDLVAALNPENSNLVYCYTGQTSSIITAWLNVLGYNVKSISFGVNSLQYTALSDAGKPHWHFPYHEYEYVTGE